jgi:molybdopterin/thiamine biosynthesis adenylyltransferase
MNSNNIIYALILKQNKKYITISDNSWISIIDYGLIKIIFDLNSQFIFRFNHEGKQKSKAAAEKAKFMDNEFSRINLEIAISEKNQEFVNENFWKGLYLIFTIVDNKSAYW